MKSRNLKISRSLRLTFFVLHFLGLSLVARSQDSLLQEFVDTEDLAVNEFMQEELKTIRENFSRITHTHEWNEIIEVPLDASTEGAVARIYKGPDGPEKIMVHYYGEMFQSLTEYYLLDYDLSFVIERTLEYNRPIYYDSLAMIENEDSEFFDPQKATLEEFRSYFIEGEIVHQLHNKDCGAPFNHYYLMEENQRIWDEFLALQQTIDANTNHEEREIIGVWQGIPVVGSGWSSNYQFFEDGTFRYNHNQMDCSDSIIYESGRYAYTETHLTLTYSEIQFISGGRLEPASGSCGSAFELVGGEEVTQPMRRDEILTLQFVSPLLDYDYLERILLDGTEWFRMMHDPNDY